MKQVTKSWMEKAFFVFTIIIGVLMLAATVTAQERIVFQDVTPVVVEPELGFIDGVVKWFEDLFNPPPAPVIVDSVTLFEMNDSVTNEWVDDVPQWFTNEECVWNEPNSTNTTGGWSACDVQNGTSQVVHAETNIVSTWQEVDDGITRFKVSDELWCAQQDAQTVMCKSVLDGDGSAHIPDFTNPGMTYVKYEAQDDTTVHTLTHGNPKVLKKALDETIPVAE